MYNMLILWWSSTIYCVTTSREEFIYVDKGNGLLDKKANQNATRNPWNMRFDNHKYNVDTVPHVL
jgi:methylenetetrahydrofolate reductase (NADPH)